MPCRILSESNTRGQSLAGFVLRALRALKLCDPRNSVLARIIWYEELQQELHILGVIGSDFQIGQLCSAGRLWAEWKSYLLAAKAGSQPSVHHFYGWLRRFWAKIRSGATLRCSWAANAFLTLKPPNILAPGSTTNFIIAVHTPQELRCHNFKWMNAAVHWELTFFDHGFRPERCKMLWLLWFPRSPGFHHCPLPVTFLWPPCCTQPEAGGPLSIYPVKIVPALWEPCLQEGHKSKIAQVTFPPVVNNHFVDLGHASNPTPTQPKSSSCHFSLQLKSPLFAKQR